MAFRRSPVRSRSGPPTSAHDPGGGLPTIPLIMERHASCGSQMAWEPSLAPAGRCRLLLAAQIELGHQMPSLSIVIQPVSLPAERPFGDLQKPPSLRAIVPTAQLDDFITYATADQGAVDAAAWVPPVDSPDLGDRVKHPDGCAVHLTLVGSTRLQRKRRGNPDVLDGAALQGPCEVNFEWTALVAVRTWIVVGPPPASDEPAIRIGVCSKAGVWMRGH